MFSFIKKLWHGETNGLTAAAFLVGGASLASRLVGVYRDRVLAGTFGAGTQLDAYYAAFRLPDFLYNLLILGALTVGFIPIFTEYLEKRGHEEAYKLARSVFSVVAVTMAAACLLLVIVAPWFIPLITPGFDADKLKLTVELTRIMALSPFLLSLSAVMGGVLQATRRFFAFSLAPILYNFGIIFGALVLSPRMGIVGVAWGVVMGAACHFLAQMSVARPLGMRGWLRPSFAHEGVRRILKLMVPRTAGLAVTQLNLVVLLALASLLGTGSVAVFNLAQNIQMFPVGIIGISFSIAAFPLLTRAVSADDKISFQAALGGAWRKIIFLILPVMALFLLLRAQIVRVILGQGKFDWDDTIRTASLLGWFAVSLVAQSLIPLLARAFYALQNTWTPFWIGLASEIINLGLALWLRGPYGIAGLAMAFSAAAFAQLVLLAIFLRRRRGLVFSRDVVISFGKTVIATMALLAVAFALRQWLGTVYPLRTFFQVFLQGAVAGVGGLLAFAFIAWLLKSQEFKEFHDGLARRLWRKVKLTEGIDEAADGV